MGLYMTAEAFAALDRLQRQVWPQPPDWHPARRHIWAPSEVSPVDVFRPIDYEPVCIILERKQHTAIKSGLLKLEDAPMMACECDDCWRLYDATEVDGGEL